jgi:uncharacterized LabA/DUF88 family protein
MSKTTAKSLTTKYDKFEASRLGFTPLEDNERSKGQKIAYPRYNHPTLGENQPLFIQGPWMTMFNYGVPSLGEYYKEDKDRAFLKCPLDMNDPEVVKMVEELKKVDETYGSEKFKVDSFGKHSKKYEFQSIIRYPLVDEDAEEDQVAKPPYMKFKLDLTWPDCNVKTEVIKSELLDSGKRVREPLEIETVGDFAGHVNYMSKFRPIFRPVKMWAHQQKMKDPQYGIVFKLVKVEVEPNKNSNNVYQNYLQGDIFVDDDEDEAEAPTVFSGVEKVEKGVDMMIGVDILKNAYEDLYDTAILVSGDGDFYPALQAAKDQGKHVEIAAFETNISPETARIADLHIKLNKTYFSNLWMMK